MADAKPNTCMVGWCTEKVAAADRCQMHFESFADPLPHAFETDECKELVCNRLDFWLNSVGLYAILSPSMNAVKFGISKSPQDRLNGLQTSSPYPLELMGAVPGSKVIEQAIHELLPDYRLQGEWFRYEGQAKQIADAIATGELEKFDRALDLL